MKKLLFTFLLATGCALITACGGDGERVSTDGGVHQGIHGPKDTTTLQTVDSVVITPDSPATGNNP